MEPLTYLVGSGWLIAGYSYFLVNKTEYHEKGLRDLIEAKQFRRIVKKQKIDLGRIDMLKKSKSDLQLHINRLS